MKKIEALLEEPPCLEDNRQTAVGTFADLPSASDPAAGAPVASSPGPDSELRDFGWSRVRVVAAVGRVSPRSVRVADSEAVDNLVRARMPSAADAGAGIGIEGHSHLVLHGPAAVVADIHLCPPPVPSLGYPSHCASIATIHDEDARPTVPEPGDPVEHPTISSVASGRLTVAPSSETSHSQ